MDDVIAVLKQQGAVIVDPGRHPERHRHERRRRNFLNWNPCSGLDNAKGRDADCSIAFKYGMKRDFNAWLKSLGDKAPVKTLTELRAVEHRAPARRRDQVRPGAISTSRTRWTCRPTARATRPIAGATRS